MFIWIHGRSTRYCDRFDGFFVIICRCSKDAYVSSFFPRTPWLWNSLPVEWFSLTYHLNDLKFRINRWHFPFRFFLIFVFLFLFILSLVVSAQPFIESNPVYKWLTSYLKFSGSSWWNETYGVSDKSHKFSNIFR